jgi:Flp pilus assembly protein TadG
MNIKFSSDNRSRTLGQHPRGQSLVEFALVLPLLVLVVAGIFDLGAAFFASITITNSAREGARYGSLHPTDGTGIKNAAVNEAQNSGITITTSNVSTECPGYGSVLPCPRGQPIRVTVNYHYPMVLGFIFPEGIDMQRSVEMIIP